MALKKARKKKSTELAANLKNWREIFAYLQASGYIKKHRKMNRQEVYRLITAEHSPVRNLNNRTLSYFKRFEMILHKDGRILINPEWKQKRRAILKEDREIMQAHKKEKKIPQKQIEDEF